MLRPPCEERESSVERVNDDRQTATGLADQGQVGTQGGTDFVPSPSSQRTSRTARYTQCSPSYFHFEHCCHDVDVYEAVQLHRLPSAATESQKH